VLAEVCLASGRREEAEAFWRKAIELNEQLGSTYPSFGWRNWADRIRGQRLAFLAQLGHAADLLSEAEAVAAKPDLTGDTWYNLACVFARAADQAGKAAAADGYRARAIALLGKAEAAGYFRSRIAVDGMRTDVDLKSLRGHKDFEEMLTRLGKGPGGN
jgi:tetratricopeptide (TPR) repeat protein